MKIIKLNLLFLLIGLFWSFAANATIVTVDFTATVDRVNFLDLSPSGVSVGASLNGRFTFDTSPNRNGDMTFQIGTFNPSSSSKAGVFHSVSDDSFSIGGSGDGSVETYINQAFPNYYSRDTFWPPSDTVTVQLEDFSIHLSQPSGVVFDIDNLIGFPSSIDTFANARFNANFYIYEPAGYFASIAGTLDSVTVSNVPLPASFWLMSTAVIGVLGFFRKQDKTTTC